MADPRVSAMLGVLLGLNFETAPGGSDPMEIEQTRPEPPKQEPAKPAPAPKEPEKELPENKKQALQEKEKGTEAYKKKDFSTALVHYSKAIELDPEDIVYKTNRSAVYFETAQYDECIKDCLDAIEQGRKVFADFKLIAR